MNKKRKIIALTGVVLLVLMYLSTLVFALIDSPLSKDLLVISLGMTFGVPIILYGLLVFHRMQKNGNDNLVSSDPSSDSSSEE